jgi:hypothetical protein
LVLTVPHDQNKPAVVAAWAALQKTAQKRIVLLAASNLLWCATIHIAESWVFKHPSASIFI